MRQGESGWEAVIFNPEDVKQIGEQFAVVDATGKLLKTRLREQYRDYQLPTA